MVVAGKEIGLDPTNNRVVDDNYVIIGSGRDYRDVAPVTGTYFGRELLKV